MEITYELKEEYIQANNLLKVAGLVSSSGEGKEVIRLGLVSLNGEVLVEMRKKIKKGDRITFEEVVVAVV